LDHKSIKKIVLTNPKNVLVYNYDYAS